MVAEPLKWFCLAVALSFGACARPLVATPKTAPHPQGAPWDQTELPEPPPTVQAEEVPPRPSRAHYWFDGQWDYRALTGRWTWSQGSWCVLPPQFLFYARPEHERHRVPSKERARVVRWNPTAARYEEVDSGDDVYRWRKGRVYVAGPDGSPRVYDRPLECVRR